MICYRKLIALMLLCIGWHFARAQKNTPKVYVDVDPGSGAFISDAGLPFDVPFTIRGPITDGLKKVTVTYWMNDGQWWMPYKDKTVKWGNKPWENVNIPAKDNKFNVEVGAIYPNTSYTFKFQFYVTPNIAADKKTALYNSLFSLLDTYIKGQNNSDVAAFNKAMNDKLSQAAGGTLADIHGTPYLMDVNDADMSPFTLALMKSNDVLLTRPGNINTSINDFSGTEYNRFYGRLRTLVQNPALLDPAATELWKYPVASQIADYKTMTVADVAKLWVDGNSSVTNILDGSKKIDGTKLLPADQFNEASASVLLAFLTAVDQGKLTQASDNKNYFAPDATIVHHLVSMVKDVIRYQAEIKKANDDKKQQMAAFPDVLATHYVLSSFEVYDRSNPDVTADDNAYIGLDFGFADTYAYNHQVFLYEGVNFYLVPINKNAPLATIHGFWRQLGKRFSIHLGLTQNVMGTPNKLYSPLIGSVGSVMLGAGFRVNRFIHLNYGEMFFYEKDVNPVIDHQHFTYKPTFSLTFDLVSTKAIGAFLGKLGIK